MNDGNNSDQGHQAKDQGHQGSKKATKKAAPAAADPGGQVSANGDPAAVRPPAGGAPNFRAIAGAVALVTVIIGVTFAVLWVVFRHFKVFQAYNLLLSRNLWFTYPSTWFVLGVALILSAVAVSVAQRRVPRGALLLATVSLIAASVWTIFYSGKNEASFYDAATVYITPDINNPEQSIVRLMSKVVATPGDERCEYVGTHNVPSCIRQGQLPVAGWEPRSGSLEGATTAIARAAGDVQRVSLNVETMTYLNTHGETASAWSGILDGSGITQPMYAVAEWSGSGRPKLCKFEGDYAIDKAFAGTRSNSLSNLLAEKYPRNFYSVDDVWGFCDGAEPVVVIPTRQYARTTNRAVEVPGGIIVVRGDHGQAAVSYEATVAAGVYPGPVYPKSIAIKQRESTVWSAGRENRNRNGFGFDPATSQAQAGNVADYLLRSVGDDSQLQWVTPLTPRSSTSEQFIAYSTVAADTVTEGELNEMDIYLLGEDDPARVNIDNLEADANNFMSIHDGTFVANGGTLIEYTPIDGRTFRVFGEMKGRVVYRLDISTESSIGTQLFRIDPNTGTETSTGGTGGGSDGGDVDETEIDCSNIADATESQLLDCLAAITDELRTRQTVPPEPTAASTGPDTATSGG